MTLKRGPFSRDDSNFVIENYHHLTIEEIASQIERDPDTVQQHIRKKGLTVVKTQEERDAHERLRVTLLDKPYWIELEKTLFEDEIKYFQENWINFIVDLSEDISFAEELILADWIITRILHLRSMQSQKAALEEILRIERELNHMRLEDVTDPSIIAQIAAGETQLAMAKSSVNQITSNADKLFTQAEKMHKSLKTDRQDRRDIKTTADTYWGYVAKLDNEEFLRAEGRKAEIMKLAAKRAKNRLMENYEFDDGEVSSVLLSDDSVLQEEGEDEDT